MHRFGRTAHQKTKDRWGGGFLLATIVLLVLAWAGGTWMANLMKSRQAATGDSPTPATDRTDPIGTMAVEPHRFELYFVQAGAFRSQAGADREARRLGEMGHPAMVAPRNDQGLYRVFAGLYTAPEPAATARSELKTDGIETYASRVLVDHNPDAIPAAAMSGRAEELRKGLALLNTYLWEVAYWAENRAANRAIDTSGIAGLGRQLGEITARLADEGDQEIKAFVAMATSASLNATDVKAAATATPSSDEYQMAMTGYLALLDQYQMYQTGK